MANGVCGDYAAGNRRGNGIFSQKLISQIVFAIAISHLFTGFHIYNNKCLLIHKFILPYKVIIILKRHSNLAVINDNRVSFSFDTPKDSAFVVGDSLVFSFNATFFSENDAAVTQEAYAAVTLEYDDESFHISGMSIKESGAFVLPVSRNFKSRLNSMSGYVYYFDNDTTYGSRMLLNDLSLKRLHPPKVKKSVTRK